MLTKNYSIPYKPNSLLEETNFTFDSIFFDIETTGFSPVKNSLYLIGCGYRDAKELHIVQYFAEQKDEEGQVLLAFLHLLSHFRTILSFNGLGFDIPFLKAKCSQLNIEEKFDFFQYIDIFKSISQYKKILQLENYKQKTLENFLGINREDCYSGGDLIKVYESYCKSPSDEALSLLLLHNHDDVLGMLPLIDLLSYDSFFKGNYDITDVSQHDFTDVNNNAATEMLIKGTIEHAVPKRLSLKSGFLFLLLDKDHFSMSVSACKDSLKFFYPNYKDYYYLPKEDMAIHKSVATYVEKEFRTPAKAATCYSKKEGIYLPQYKEFFAPAFYHNYKDKISYFSFIDPKEISGSLNFKDYISDLLFHFYKDIK